MSIGDQFMRTFGMISNVGKNGHGGLSTSTLSALNFRNDYAYFGCRSAAVVGRAYLALCPPAAAVFLRQKRRNPIRAQGFWRSANVGTKQRYDGIALFVSTHLSTKIPRVIAETLVWTGY